MPAPVKLTVRITEGDASSRAEVLELSIGTGAPVDRDVLTRMVRGLVRDFGETIVRRGRSGSMSEEQYQLACRVFEHGFELELETPRRTSDSEKMANIMLGLGIDPVTNDSQAAKYEAVEEGRARAILAFNKFQEEAGKSRWTKTVDDRGTTVVYYARLRPALPGNSEGKSLRFFPN